MTLSQLRTANRRLPTHSVLPPLVVRFRFNGTETNPARPVSVLYRHPGGDPEPPRYFLESSGIVLRNPVIRGNRSFPWLCQRRSTSSFTERFWAPPSAMIFSRCLIS